MSARLLLGFLLCSCETPSAVDERAAAFLAMDDRGDPVGGVLVWLDGQEVGRTGVDGRFQVVARASEGAEVELAARCPEGYEQALAPQRIGLWHLHGLDGSAEPGLEISIECPRRMRVAVIAIRADGGAGLPVVVNGERVGVTDSSGAAHHVARVTPGTSLTVRLVTSDQPSLRPQNPTRRYVVATSDEIFIFDDKLVVEKATRTRHRRSVREPEPELAPRRPVRIE